MTVLIGVRCSNGVVVGADSAATSAIGNFHLLKMASEKIAIIGERVIVAGTGQVGLGQRFAAVVKQAYEKNHFTNNDVEVARILSNYAIQNFSSTNAPTSQYGALVAAPIEDKGQLIEFAVNDFQPELKTEKLHFVAMGSGQALAEPFVSFVSRTFWRGQIPDVQSAVFGVHWALRHTITCAPGGVGDPIVIAKLEKTKGKWKAEMLSDDVLGEQTEHISAIESHIANYKDRMLGEVEAKNVPTLP